MILIYYNLPVSQRFQQQFQYCEGAAKLSPQVSFLSHAIISRSFHLNGATIIICSAINIEHTSFLLKEGLASSTRSNHQVLWLWGIFFWWVSLSLFCFPCMQHAALLLSQNVTICCSAGILWFNPLWLSYVCGSLFEPLLVLMSHNYCLQLVCN